MFVLRSTCFQAPCHVYAKIYMPMCYLPCLCLNLHAYMFFAILCLDLYAFCVLCHVCAQIYMFMLRSMSLYLDLCVYVLCAMLVCSYLCWLLCHVLLQPFLSFEISLSCFLALSVRCRSRSCGLGHTQAYIKAFGSFPLCISMFASMLYAYVRHSRSRFCQALRPSQASACVVAFVPPRAYLDVTICEIHLRGVGGLTRHLSPLRPMLMCLPCLLCTTSLAFFAFFPFCMLAYMFMHESVCHPYSNPMELRTLDPNLHLSSQDTPFCLITCLFTLSYAQHALYAPVWLSLVVCSSHALPISFVCFFACLPTCFSCICIYTHGARILGARVRPPRSNKNGKDAIKRMQAHKGK